MCGGAGAATGTPSALPLAPSEITQALPDASAGQGPRAVDPNPVCFGLVPSEVQAAVEVPPVASEVHATDATPAHWFGFIAFMGSGFLAAVAFLDPGNLEADIAVGVTSGYQLLWWYGLCTLCFGYAFQVLSGKVGLVTGTDLASLLGRTYPRPAALLLWVLLEMSVLAADIQETVGCALAVQILSKGSLPLWAACLIVSVAAFMLLQLDRLGFRHLESLYAALIGLEAVALGVVCVSAKAPVGEVMQGFIPKLSADTVVVAAGALGALVMPYNTFFLSHVINGRPKDTGTDSKKRTLMRYLKVETLVTLSLAFVINIFAVVIFSQFYGIDYNEYQNAGLESAGSMLNDVYGNTMATMWAVGLLASGLVATICLTYAGQIIMVGLMQIKVQATWRLMATRLISLVPCLTLAVVFEATNTFDQVAQTINVIQSLILPFGLIPIIHVTANPDVMGAKWVNRNWVTVGVSTITAAIIGINVFTLASLMMQLTVGVEPQVAGGIYLGFSALIALYCALVAYFTVGPNNWPALLSRTRSNAYMLFVWLKTNRRWADIESMLEVHY